MSYLWDFVKRHRNKLIFAGVLAGGVYAGKKFMSLTAGGASPSSFSSLRATGERNLAAFRDEDVGDLMAPDALFNERCDPETRKMYIFTSNQKACENTIIQIVPTINDSLQQRFDIEKLLESLKNGDADKIMVFEAVKVMSFSRLFTASYVYSLLIISLKVQISIVAGDIYARNFPSRQNLSSFDISNWRDFVHAWFNKKTLAGSASSQQIFLQALQYFLTQGIIHFADKVDKIVNSTIGELSLKQMITFDQLQRLIFEIRAKVDGIRNYSQFVVPMIKDFARGDGSQALTTAFGDQKLTKMLLNLKQSLESRQFFDVLRMFVDEFLSKSAEFVRTNRSEWSTYRNGDLMDNRVKDGPDNDLDNFGPSLNANTAIPLAKILPILSDSFNFISKTESRSIINRLLNSVGVTDFCLDVFDKSLSSSSPIVDLSS